MKKLPIFTKWVIIILIIILIAGVLIFWVTSYGKQSESKTDESDLKNIVEIFENVKSIEIDLQKIELQIKKGEQVKIEYPEILKALKIEQNEEKLDITDEELSIDEDSEQKVITVYLPDNEKLDMIDLEVKNKNINIEKLNTANLKLNINENDCNINEILSDSIELNNQSGKLTINDCETKSINMHSETGHDKLNMKITEMANITINSSSTEVNLLGNEQDYQVNTTTTNSSMYVKMGRMDNGQQTIGTGNVKVIINAENTALYINFKEE